jgi:hypothetical protein
MARRMSNDQVAAGYELGVNRRKPKSITIKTLMKRIRRRARRTMGNRAAHAKGGETNG